MSSESQQPSDVQGTSNWSQRRVEPLGLLTGPCAWRASMLVGQTPQTSDEAVAYLLAHPSLVIVEPEDDVAVMDQVAKVAEHMPVMLCMDEPAFVRRLDEQVRKRVAQLKQDKAAGVILRVEELSELKAGGLLQALFSLREQGVIDHVGLAAEDVRGAEWLAPQTAARVLRLPYSLADQSARYRALPLAAEMEQLCIASQLIADITDETALAFALGDASRVLPVLDKPLPARWRAMTADEVDAAWSTYQQSHEAPAKLPRSHAPE